MRAVADADMVAFQTAFFERVDFIEQNEWIDHDTGADDTERVFAENTGGKKMQNCLLTIDDHRVAGIVAALEADNKIYIGGQKVDDFSFAFVAPLGTYHDITCHIRFTFNATMIAHDAS